MPPNNLSGTIILKIQVAGLGGMAGAGRAAAAGAAATQVSGPSSRLGPIAKWPGPSTKMPGDYKSPDTPQDKRINKKGMMSLGKYLPLIAGITGIAGILAHSKILSQTSRTISELMGTLVDVLLMPFIPALVKIMTGLAKFIQGVMKFMADPIGFLSEMWLKLIDWVTKEWNILIGEKIPRFFEIFIDFILLKWNTFVSSITNSWKEFWDNPLEFIKTKFKEFTEWLKTPFEKFIFAILQMIPGESKLQKELEAKYRTDTQMALTKEQETRMFIAKVLDLTLSSLNLLPRGYITSREKGNIAQQNTNNITINITGNTSDPNAVARAIVGAIDDEEERRTGGNN